MKRTLRITARYGDVWNAAGGSPEEVAASSRILDQHCADVRRDPSQIRRSVQLPVSSAGDELVSTVEAFATVGVTDFILILQAVDPVGPVALGEQLATLLPRLRAVG